MADQKDAQEKTEQPTPRRLQKAREEGQVARSRELNTMGILLVGAASLLLTGDELLSALADIMRSGLRLGPAEALDTAQLALHLRSSLEDALRSVLPFLVLVAVAALVAPMALGGWSFATKALAFKWEKLDPIKGVKRLFALRGVMELVKALVKFLVVASVAVTLLWGKVQELLLLGRQPLETALPHGAYLVAWSFFVVCSALVVIAAVDVPFQIWDHARKLRMSRQEVKDEYKETEGRPEVKSRIRSLQREMAQRRMMDEVPKADVIITNPTHYAVALRYDPERMAAPRVVAKGADLVALRIRQVGEMHGVPRVEQPPLARAIYFHGHLGKEIPAGLYLAVAQVLAHVFQLRAQCDQDGPVPAAPNPENIQVPEEFRSPAPNEEA